MENLGRHPGLVSRHLYSSENDRNKSDKQMDPVILVSDLQCAYHSTFASNFCNSSHKNGLSPFGLLITHRKEEEQYEKRQKSDPMGRQLHEGTM